MNTTTETTDFGMWKFLAWCGPIFLAIFTGFWGLLAHNTPPVGADLTPLEIAAHYTQNNMAIIIGMSVCMVGAAFYFPWGCAIAQLIRRIDGPNSILAQLENMGATVTVVFPIVACGIWLTTALEMSNLTPELVHVMYRLGWMIIDLAYMVTTFQIFAVSIAFLRDKREKPLVPAWVCWWGFITCIAFFPVSLIPFFKTGPFAFQGLINFWIAFFTWYIWCGTLSFFTIKAIGRLQQDEQAAIQSPKATLAEGRPVMA
ncbi:hypothetical protein [Pseudomonas fluorescens]|uniref:DUF4386 domain-containing protein n=1 Tax=Pseudomonas fluorescens TaxID=294 RepID=A0A5E7UXX9_PSEFL|nr:hypothetical protein [Pseudomonas fluorescens]VVQ15479.1 hypothetical protein PS928_04267 [Pseudomonas fluorescens]